METFYISWISKIASSHSQTVFRREFNQFERNTFCNINFKTLLIAIIYLTAKSIIVRRENHDESDFLLIYSIVITNYNDLFVTDRVDFFDFFDRWKKKKKKEKGSWNASQIGLEWLDHRDC